MFHCLQNVIEKKKKKSNNFFHLKQPRWDLVKLRGGQKKKTPCTWWGSLVDCTLFPMQLHQKLKSTHLPKWCYVVGLIDLEWLNVAFLWPKVKFHTVWAWRAIKPWEANFMIYGTEGGGRGQKSNIRSSRGAAKKVWLLKWSLGCSIPNTWVEFG